MKKFIFIITILFMLIAPIFARQFTVVYNTKDMSTEMISAKIDNYLNHGFKLVSMVAVSNNGDRIVNGGATTSIIVVFDDCTE
jgi:predicted PurR-regulated permease PerM